MYYVYIYISLPEKSNTVSSVTDKVTTELPEGFLVKSLTDLSLVTFGQFEEHLLLLAPYDFRHRKYHT